MMKHEMKIRAIYFDKIKRGEKIYEVRLNDEKRQLIDVGDVIVLKKEPELCEELFVEVKDLIYFDSFAEMVNTLPKEKVGFAEMKNEAIVDVYHQFYTPEAEKKHGVVAINVQVLK
ncbi:MAG: ASCH domain-containing protein [Clostridia bacterium]|nr:ASCH domain-containing protein [Clostridia bacterium]